MVKHPGQWLTGCLWSLLLLFPADGFSRQNAPDSIAYRHLSLSQTLFLHAQPDPAFAELKLAQKGFTASGSKIGQAAATKLLAGFYASSGLDSIALSLYSALLQQQPIPLPDSLLAIVHLDAAKIYFRNKQYQRALEHDVIALATFRTSGTRSSIADACFEIASAKLEQGKPRDAEQLLLRQCLPLYSGDDNQEGRCRTFNALAKTYLRMSLTSQAKWFYIQNNLLAVQRNDPYAIAGSLIGLGKVKTRLKEYDMAINDLNSAERISVQHSLFQPMAEASYALWNLYTLLNKRPQAAKAFAGYQRYTALVNDGLAKKTALALRLRNAGDQQRVKVANYPSLPVVHSGSASYWLLAFVILITFAFAGILFIKFYRNRS